MGKGGGGGVGWEGGGWLLAASGSPLSQCPLRSTDSTPALLCPSRPQTALILCPNTALCAQVAEVARSLVDSETGLPLASVVAVSNDAAPPTGDIDLLIATPSGLMSKLRVRRASASSQETLLPCSEASGSGMEGRSCRFGGGEGARRDRKREGRSHGFCS